MFFETAVFLLDLILSILDQMKICKTAISPSDNQRFNEPMDEFFSSFIVAFWKVGWANLEAEKNSGESAHILYVMHKRFSYNDDLNDVFCNFWCQNSEKGGL